MLTRLTKGSRHRGHPGWKSAKTPLLASDIHWSPRLDPDTTLTLGPLCHRLSGGSKPDLSWLLQEAPQTRILLLVKPRPALLCPDAEGGLKCQSGDIASVLTDLRGHPKGLGRANRVPPHLPGPALPLLCPQCTLPSGNFTFSSAHFSFLLLALAAFNRLPGTRSPAFSFGARRPSH